jgi:hypothetical protein
MPISLDVARAHPDAYRLFTNVSMIGLAGNRRNASAAGLMRYRVTVTLTVNQRLRRLRPARTTRQE